MVGARGGCWPPMDLFRSEVMQLVQLTIPIESAHLTVSYLGDLGLLQFKDLNAGNSLFQRTYAAQIKKCGEMARKLHFSKEQMEKAGMRPTFKELGELEADLVEKATGVFSSALNLATAQQREMESHHSGEESLSTPFESGISFTGRVPKEKSLAFERIIFHATRGNVFIRQATVDEPVVDPISGEKGKPKSKILQISEAFGANRYPFNEDHGKQAQMMTEVKIMEMKTTINAGLFLRNNLLQPTSNYWILRFWLIKVRKEKSIFHILNMVSLDVTKKCLVAEGWSSVFAAKQIQDALQRASFDSSSQVGTIFQFQEANPGVYTIITFPFLFAIMFVQQLGDITEMTFGGRYVIMMMALFSIYTCLIYNEFFSVPFELIGPSAYACRNLSCRRFDQVALYLPIWCGVDPAWHGTRSELPFLNSLKMKMSILPGVAQMNLGFQFIRQMIFLNWWTMKWWTGLQADLYHVMVCMFLSPADELGENQLFPGQKIVQLVLLLLALVSVPRMLLPNRDRTIEFVLGAVSNTASYLRLWALSLAHSELSLCIQ
ncbi:hypothetical protein K2173_013643 [Erythroxylum novogranatense]|uniref:V-type proton ATPase subunit a n=1 Tax=Erythroxylum novogranatense TaxID=1862640 RepID=A0AAV8TK28_9ROSI|nr:hypothetical protein K2173_013643 [Erythroxylum novogranatense]